jgi:hypothetical protein
MRSPLFHLAVALALLALCLAGCQTPRRADLGPVAPAVRGPPPGASDGADLAVSSIRPLEPDQRGAPARPQRLFGRWPRDALRVRSSGHKEPVREVLARLGLAARLNFVLADEVGGQVTTSLEELPWREVLEALLEAKDLVAEREGNVVWVLPRVEHQREQSRSR